MFVIKLSFIGLLVLLLSACAVTPNTLGISRAEWQGYSTEKQQQLIDSYHKVKASVSSDSSVVAIPNINVVIKGGKAMMPPFAESYSFMPVKFDIRSGECKEVRLRNIDLDKDIELGACFSGKILYLDPSRYDVTKQNGSIRIYVTPLWKRGFTYNNINSSGYARLKNVSITVKAMGEK